MIDTKYPTPDVFDDAVTATAYIARVDVTHGELRLPPRVREHLDNGDVVVHLVRGEDDETQCTATLTATSKLVGITWPEDIVAGTRVVVMCPRGAAGHDVAVQLPDLPEPTVTFLGPAPDEDDEPEQGDELAAEAAQFADESLVLAELAMPAANEALAAVEADYTIPTTLRLVADEPTERIAAVKPDWPTAEHDTPAAVETTTIITATGQLPPLKVAWSAFRRRLTAGRTVLLTAVVAVVITWAVAWVVIGR